MRENKRYSKRLFVIIWRQASRLVPEPFPKYTDLNLSSATIRNEMSDLEEMGYILQPHTSAGRIPSDKSIPTICRHDFTEKKMKKCLR